MKPFDETLRVTNPVRQRRASSREASLAWGRAIVTAKRSGYRNRSGDASIGGKSETVEVSQPHLQEVIPVSSKAYRATRVNEVNWEQIARGKEGLGVTVGIDVEKFDLLVICRWAGKFACWDTQKLSVIISQGHSSLANVNEPDISFTFPDGIGTNHSTRESYDFRRGSMSRSWQSVTCRGSRWRSPRVSRRPRRQWAVQTPTFVRLKSESLETRLRRRKAGVSRSVRAFTDVKSGVPQDPRLDLDHGHGPRFTHSPDPSLCEQSP